MPVALIVGHTGQDGHYLSELLESEGTTVVGRGRRGTSSKRLGIDSSVTVDDSQGVTQIVRDLRPAQVYYLAAHHHSSEDAPEDTYTGFVQGFAVHVGGLLNFLVAIDRYSRSTRLFYAASARIFGDPPTVPQDETTPLAPICTYGITKAAGVEICRLYRRNPGIFCSVGILYNHESPRRSETFVGRKIARAVAAIKRGKRDNLVLGDLDAAVDWGAATDYVRAMHKTLQIDQPDDFIISSGELHTVGEFVDLAFSAAGLECRLYVVEDSRLIRKSTSTRQLFGNPERVRSRTGWRPQKPFADIVREMVDAELASGTP